MKEIESKIAAKLGSLLALQPLVMTCAFCHHAYRRPDIYRPGFVCDDCWPEISAIERKAADRARSAAP